MSDATTASVSEEQPTLVYSKDGAARNRAIASNTVLVGGAVVLLGLVPLLYHQEMLSITAINQLGRFLAIAIVALGIDLVWGYAGILSLCQAMFFCFGGYAIGMHLALHGPLDGNGVPQALAVVSSKVGGMHLPWFWKPFSSLPLALTLGLLLPGLFAFVFGYFTFRSRVRGVYFSIITQAMTVAAVLVFQMNEMQLCGTNGLTNFVTLAGFELQKSSVKFGLYFVSAVMLVLVYLMCHWIVTSRLGRLLKAVRDNESRLRFAGYQPVLFKTFVFVFGAVLAGLGGMLYTPQNGIITPFKMVAMESVFMVVIVAVGGRGTLVGAVLGAVLVSYLNSLLTSGTFYNLLPTGLQMPASNIDQSTTLYVIRRFLKVMLGSEGWPFVLGGLFVLVTLLLPDGVVGMFRKLYDRVTKSTGSEAA